MCKQYTLTWMTSSATQNKNKQNHHESFYIYYTTHHMSDNYFWYLYPDDVSLDTATPNGCDADDDDARRRRRGPVKHATARRTMMTIRARVTAPATTRGTYTRNETHGSKIGMIQSASTRGRRGQSWQDADVCTTVSWVRCDGKRSFGRSGGAA